MSRTVKYLAAQPLVSVCMSAYNHEIYIAQAIDSVLAQSYPNIEIVIVDDASSDRSSEIIRQYVQRCPQKIKAIFLSVNEGPCLAGNRAYAAARGDFIAFLGTDDRMLPQRIAEQVRFLLKNPDHVGVFSNIAVIDAVGKRVSTPNEMELLFNQRVSNFRRHLLSGNFLNAPSALLRRHDLLAVGGSSPLLRFVQDYDLWGKLLQRGELCKIDEVLTEYRVHGKNLSLSGSPSYAARCETVSVIVDMAQKSSLQSLFDRPLRTSEDQVNATLELVEILKRVDIHYLQRPALGCALAYRFILQASLIDPQKCQLAKRDLEVFMEAGFESRQTIPFVRHLLPDRETLVGVVVHVSCVDALTVALDCLKRIETSVYIYATCYSAQLNEVSALLSASALPHVVLQVENQGGDSLPFLRVLSYLKHDDVSLFVKLHAQRINDTNKTAVEERNALYSMLLAPSFLQSCVQRFERELELQLLGLDGQNLPISHNLTESCRLHLEELSRRTGLPIERVLSAEYVAGGMFFARRQGLEPLLELGLRDEDFGREQEQADEGLAHALERFFLVFADARQLSNRTVLYRRWLTTRRLSENDHKGLVARLAGWPSQPSILIVIDDFFGADELISRTLNSLQEQLYAPAAIVVLSTREPVGIEPADNLLWLSRSEDGSGQLNEILPQIQTDWFYLLRAGDRLDPHALLLLAQHIVDQPNMRCCYSDEDRISKDPDDYEEPVFKPDFNLDMLRSYPYVGRALAFQRQSFIDIGGFESTFQGLAPHDLLFRLVERCGLTSIGHIAEVLVHQHQHLGQWLLEEGVQAQVAPLVTAHLDRLSVPHRVEPGVLRMVNRVTYLFSGSPLVSIVIPTKNQLGILRRCVETLLEKTRYKNYEVLIVDNASDEPDALAWLSEVERLASNKLRVLRYPLAFNFSAINNFAIDQARGDYLVLLNNDTAVVNEDWLDMLLNHARRPEVGIVGAKLHFPDGRIQHGGVLLGLRGCADHPYIGEARESKGYMQRLQIDQNYSAVTAACLMIRKAVYHEVGGMDEEGFKVSFNDVDLCLKVNRAGYLTVWTPYAVLLHEANVSQKLVDKTALEAKAERFRGEQALMYRKWLPKLAHDPAYNKNLNLDGKGFAHDDHAETGWQPFTVRQRPYILARTADPYGCGNYRLIKPLAALRKAGLVDGSDSYRLYSVVEMERIAADSVIFQRQLLTMHFGALCNVKHYSQSFRVFELDDYVIDLPAKSVHRATMPKDIATLLRQAVAQCDRFVVSTAPLAEALGDLHTDIRVVENRLPVDWWSEVSGLAQRRVGRKPRVGWAGGSSHTGDLELIVDVVRALAGEVEWVFLGMCPALLRPYVHEFHVGVNIEQYPAKLAGLNLDLALAPLEDNLFNRCKSNLRLLEYGICGFPVICSDNLCYRGDLPVTRVQNRSRDWLQAIRMHLADLDATARAGDALREAVRSGWMLEGEHLQGWRSAWLAG
jgi:glycosyltransferase involved in cell wall biosynthesis